MNNRIDWTLKGKLRIRRKETVSIHGKRAWRRQRPRPEAATDRARQPLTPRDVITTTRT